VRRAATLLAHAAHRAPLTEACIPGLAHAAATFRTLRAVRLQEGVAGGPQTTDAFLAAHGASTKPEILWELELARQPGFTAALTQAEHTRQSLEASAVRFLQEYDVFVCPCTLMAPFAAALRYPTRRRVGRAEPPAGGGKAADTRDEELMFADYIEWMLPCSALSLTGLPCLAMPAGCTRDGRLHVGVQLVGRHGGEASLLAAAALLQRALHEDVSNDSFFQGTSVLPVPIDPIRPTVERMAFAAGAPRGGSGGYSGGGVVARADESAEWSGPTTAEEAAAHLQIAPAGYEILVCPDNGG